MSIIGIVAVLSLTGLIQRQHEKQYVEKFKKEFSAIANAIDLAVVENGPIRTWDLRKANSNLGTESDKILQIISPYLAVTKICEHQDTSCVGNIEYKNLHKTKKYCGDDIVTSGNYARAVLKDGAIIYVGYHYVNKAIYFKIDLNGEKGPNVMGIDLFDTFVKLDKDDNGLIPSGIDDTTYEDCSLNKNTIYGCEGSSCAGYIIKNNNMNYLHK